MNTLPPEMIREIYSKMDAATAYTFRKTCRDYNQIFVDNPSTIARFDSTLYILFPMGQKLDVTVRLPKFIENNNGRRPLHHTVYIRRGREVQGSEPFANSLKLIFRENNNGIAVPDPVDVLPTIVATLMRVFRFTEVTFVGSDIFKQTHLNDRLLRMFIDLAADAVEKLEFSSATFRSTDADNWHRMLRVMKAKELRLKNCVMYRDDVSFSEEDVMYGMTCVSKICLMDDYTRSQIDTKYLLRNDKIEQLELLMEVDCQEIINKLERYINGDFPIISCSFLLTDFEEERFTAYLDAVYKRTSLSDDSATYEMATKKGNRRAKILLIFNDHWLMTRFEIKETIGLHL